MKKILLNVVSVGSFSALVPVLLVTALMTQSCGSSSSGGSTGLTIASAGTTTTTTTTGTSGQGFAQCETGEGQIYTQPTSNGSVQVCRYQSPWESFDISAESITLSSSKVASGGELTNIQVSAGDTIYVYSVGHYSPSGGVCDSNNGGGDISVLGGSDKSQDPTINPKNGSNDGLWYAFEDQDANYSAPVNATSQYDSSSNYQTITVPSTVVGTAQIVLGYNVNGSIGCGDMGMVYSIVSCVDENGNTYTCQ
jgi:hypothetical protein